MSSPSLLQKILYLGGKRAPEDHRAWIEGVLGAGERRTGLMLAVPNAVLMAVVAALSLFVGDLGYAVFLVAAATVVLVAGAAIPAITRSRARKLAAKNGLRMPY